MGLLERQNGNNMYSKKKQKTTANRVLCFVHFILAAVQKNIEGYLVNISGHVYLVNINAVIVQTLLYLNNLLSVVSLLFGIIDALVFWRE